MDFVFKIENFEGPLDLLLELIKTKKMDIYDLQISQITNYYMQTLSELKENNIEITSDFMEMASNLLCIKAKMLIPVEVEKNDPRNELVKQLLEYQEYKETVEELKILKSFEQKYYKRQKVESIRKEKNGSIQDIINSYKNIFNKRFKQPKNKAFDSLTQELMKSKFNLDERMNHMENILADEKEIDIEHYFSCLCDKEEMVVTFGAILELVKMQKIDILLKNEKVYLIEKVEMENV